MVIPHWVNLPCFFRLDGNYLATSCPSAPSYRHRHRHRRLDRCRRPAPSPAENKTGKVKKKTKTRTTATTTVISMHLFKEAGRRSNSNSDRLRRWIESKQVLLAVDVVANLVVFFIQFSTSCHCWRSHSHPKQCTKEGDTAIVCKMQVSSKTLQNSSMVKVSPQVVLGRLEQSWGIQMVFATQICPGLDH